MKVRFYWMGSIINSIQGCYPTTTQRGGFELLSFDPGPVHLSLDNLAVEGYPSATILTLSLVRTSYQHGDQWWRTPILKPSTSSSSQVAELQRRATTPNWLGIYYTLSDSFLGKNCKEKKTCISITWAKIQSTLLKCKPSHTGPKQIGIFLMSTPLHGNL